MWQSFFWQDTRGRTCATNAFGGSDRWATRKGSPLANLMNGPAKLQIGLWGHFANFTCFLFAFFLSFFGPFINLITWVLFDLFFCRWISFSRLHLWLLLIHDAPLFWRVLEACEQALVRVNKSSLTSTRDKPLEHYKRSVPGASPLTEAALLDASEQLEQHFRSPLQGRLSHGKHSRPQGGRQPPHGHLHHAVALSPQSTPVPGQHGVQAWSVHRMHGGAEQRGWGQSWWGVEMRTVSVLFDTLRATDEGYLTRTEIFFF